MKLINRPIYTERIRPFIGKGIIKSTYRATKSREKLYPYAVNGRYKKRRFRSQYYLYQHGA